MKRRGQHGERKITVTKETRERRRARRMKKTRKIFNVEPFWRIDHCSPARRQEWQTKNVALLASGVSRTRPSSTTVEPSLPRAPTAAPIRG